MIGKLLKGAIVGKILNFALRKFQERGSKKYSS